MARIRISDHLQAHRFWALDLVPSRRPPFFVLNPLLGFSAISGIELTVQHEAYRPINEMTPRHLVESAAVAPVTFSRGATLTSGDFYRWVQRHMEGTDSTRRKLLVIHFSGIKDQGGAAGLALGALGASLPVGGGFTGLLGRVPARAWLLNDCVPTRYASGGLDATSGTPVIMELEVQPHKVVQIDLGSVF